MVHNSKNPDFVGYATKNDVKCSDGRIIRHDAFKDNDGMRVPLVWMHDHKNPDNVLGNVILHNQDDGVVCEGFLNDTDRANNVRKQLAHGDYTSLSIFANRLKQEGNNVVHGLIREVSLVLAGANPEASIMNVAIQHSGMDDEILDDTAIFYTGDDNTALEHADDIKKQTTEASTKAPSKEVKDTDMADDTSKTDDSEETVGDVMNTLTPKQKEVVTALIGMAISGEGLDDEEDDEVEHSDEGPMILVNKDDFDMEGDDVLKHNAFEQNGTVVAHSGIDTEERNEIFAKAYTAARRGSFQGRFMEALSDEVANSSDSSLAHAFDSGDAITTGANGYGAKTATTGSVSGDPTGVNKYGFGSYNSLKLLFPDAKLVGGIQALDNDESWVKTVLDGVGKSMFSRIKTISYDLGDDLTEADEAKVRARGYITGNMKFEQWYDLKSRETTPTTIYVKNRLDNDDLIDLGNNFDIVPFMWNNMRIKLNQEIARSILLGDGRTKTSVDKIDPRHIRPIVSESEAYRLSLAIPALPKVTDTDDVKTAWLNQFIDMVTVRMADMKGTGSPTMFVGRKTILRILTARDKIGHRLYNNLSDLASAIGVSSIVPMDQMDGYIRSDFDENDDELKRNVPIFGTIVNLADYNVGTDKGGEITTFNQFDIDFNQHKYLMEGRMSGALTKLKGAMTIELPKA